MTASICFTSTIRPTTLLVQATNSTSSPDTGTTTTKLPSTKHITSIPRRARPIQPSTESDDAKTIKTEGTTGTHNTNKSYTSENSIPRTYRCSRCGKIGHNIRRCNLPYTYFRQRCGICGASGHNARNCPDVQKQANDCRVCRGAGKLCCSGCHGAGFHSPIVAGKLTIQDQLEQQKNEELWRIKTNSLSATKPKLSESQRLMAQRARNRVRGVLDSVVYSDSDDPDEDNSLIGGNSVFQINSGKGRNIMGKVRERMRRDRCERCLGRGYLSCMACSA